ncbi:MAG: lipopolysaccharide heptosyltransferase II [Terriglobia bacterium]
MSTDLSAAEKILVRVPNWVGDVVLSLPALAALRARFPRAELVVLARPSVADLYRDVPGLDRLFVFDHRGPLGLARLAAQLRRERFDLAVLFQNAFQAALLALLAGIPRRLGYRRDVRGPLLTHPVAVPRPGEIASHESYYYLELLRRAGLLAALPRVEQIRLVPAPRLVAAMEMRLRQLGADSGRLRVVMAPGAAYGSAKCWLPERYGALADRLVESRGAAIVLCGTSGEAELAQRIARAMHTPAVSLVGQTSLREFLALLGVSQLFIGNDSGAMHLAAAVGLPQVIVFGPTDEGGTGPVNPRARIVKHPVSCSPCFLRHCPIDHRCMTRITVDDVWQGVETALADIVVVKSDAR